MAHPIFNIPEILRLICKELDGHDLKPLLIVSRPFFVSAIPFVWKYVSSSRKLRNLAFPDVDINHDRSRVDGIGPLDDESLSRFNLYAPYVKRIKDYIDWKNGDVNWIMLLRAVPTRPLLPNLQFVTIHDLRQSLPFAQVIDALLCPTLVEIRVPGCRSGDPHPVLSPHRIARIAESCPNIQTLQLYSKFVPGRPEIAPASGTPPSDSLLTSLEQLRNLRFLGAGPEILSYDVLVLLGSLPSLESLMMLIPDDTPQGSIPSQFPRSTDSFPALQHLGIYYESPSLLSRLWKTLPFVQRVTSVWIKIDTVIMGTDDDAVIIQVRDLLSSVCQFSPHIADFHLDLNSKRLPLDLELFTPEVIGHLGLLPLRRMRIITGGSLLLPPEDYEQLARALPNVEYLEIQECYFTPQAFECVAKHMPELQYLAVVISSSNWPLVNELPLAPSSSSSVLGLRFYFTVDPDSLEGYVSVDHDFVESISTTLLLYAHAAQTPWHHITCHSPTPPNPIEAQSDRRTHASSSAYHTTAPTSTEPLESGKTDLTTAVTFITTVRPYVEPYVEPLLWRGVSWALGDVERPSDAVREVERWKEKEKEREASVMDGLGPYLYHERQEPGSMMCGQHALNNLLQGNYFTPPVLAEIAHKLDEMERDVGEASQRGGRSTNMDDTGYFSVQVLEDALKNVFGLTLVRWRSEELRRYQAVPDTQLAFILNLEQHWFTLRRFGRPGGKGFWFNLNSFLSAPEWVGNTYLGMVLQQAEREGYSVFAVRPADPNNPENMLPETEADIIAETLSDTAIEGQRPAAQLSTSRTHAGPAAIESGSGSSARSPPPTGLEGEDVELQRALQASIAAGYGTSGTIYEFPDEPSASTSRPAASSSRSGGLGLGYGGDVSRGSSSGPPSRRTPIPSADDPPTPQFDPGDPVAASAARARLRLEQMQREQAAAMQAMGTYGFGAGMDEAIDSEGARRRREAQERVRRAREEEEEQLRRAMAESLAAHESRQVDVEGDDSPEYFVTPPTATAQLPTVSGDRNYDDEDAELQAALKASLEEHTANAGGAGGSSSVPVPRVSVPLAPAPAKPTADEDDEDEDEDDEEEATPAPSSPEVEVRAVVADPDELRRRRLARFGG